MLTSISFGGRKAPEISVGFILDFLMMKIHGHRLGPNLLYRILFSRSYFPLDTKEFPAYRPEDMNNVYYYPEFIENFKKITQLIDAGKLTEEELAEVVFSTSTLFEVMASRNYFTTRLTTQDYFPLRSSYELAA